jgi:hypothetical protein
MTTKGGSGLWKSGRRGRTEHKRSDTDKIAHVLKRNRDIVFAMAPANSHVVFIPRSSRIHCQGCDESIPLSRCTMQNQLRIVEELTMARDLHRDCADKTPKLARMSRVWREGFLKNQFNGGREPERLAYRV